MSNYPACDRTRSLDEAAPSSLSKLLRRAIQPLQKGAELAPNGEMFVRLGEVDIQREDWAGAATALDRGINKGMLKDTANAQMLMGIALFSQKKLAEAKTWFQRSSQSEKHRQMSRNYIALIESQQT